MGRQQPETALVRQIRDGLSVMYPGIYVLKVAGGPYQSAGVPDLLVCVSGRFVGIEVKRQRPGESLEAARARATPRQQAVLDKIREAGGVAGVVVSMPEAIDLVEEALRNNLA